MNNSTDLSTPPYTNRGAQDTEGERLTSTVDWFSCTFLVTDSTEEVSRMLGIEPHLFKPTKTGGKGYKKSLIFQSIRILYDGTDDMGIHVDMSGEGCRTFEKYSNLTWSDLFIRFSVHYIAMVNITRIDIAVDDFHGYFRIPNLINYIKKGQVTSKFKMARRISNFIIQTGEEIGHTVYFGQPSSMMQIRFYEKNIEQEMKGNIVPDSAQIWNRTEIQARDDRAFLIVQQIASRGVESLGGIVTGILKNYINFRRAFYVKGKKTTDSNKSRWDTAKFWLDFLGDVEPLKLTLKPTAITIERKYAWVDKSVKKTLAMLAVAFPNDTETLINHFLDSGYEGLEEGDWDIINNFMAKEISLDEYMNKIKKGHFSEEK